MIYFLTGIAAFFAGVITYVLWAIVGGALGRVAALVFVLGLLTLSYFVVPR
jgi:hypothetical protein